jgi:hypothetical protein
MIARPVYPVIGSHKLDFRDPLWTVKRIKEDKYESPCLS